MLVNNVIQKEEKNNMYKLIGILATVLAAGCSSNVVDLNTTNGGGTAVNVDLNSAGNYVVLAMSGISTVPTSTITGNIGLSPAASSFITGFSLTADTTNVFATSPQVTGSVYAATYSPPTPANLTTAVNDMQTAYTAAGAQAAHTTELGAGNIGGLTLTAGVYKWGTGLTIPTDLTLSGSATDVWVFEIAQNLTVASAVKVVLSGGANASNIFWQVAGNVDLGTTSSFAGTILCQTAITMETGAALNGRAFSQTAVILDSNTITQP
jgi:hypothetical protein